MQTEHTCQSLLLLIHLEPSYLAAASNASCGIQLLNSVRHVVQGLRHLQQAMASHIRMKGVSFHEFEAQKDTGVGTEQPAPDAPAIQNDAVRITPVVLSELPTGSSRS